jgi:hypothetical protein
VCVRACVYGFHDVLGSVVQVCACVYGLLSMTYEEAEEVWYRCVRV